MSLFWLDFEKPVVELEGKIRELRELATSEEIEVAAEIVALERKVESLRREIFSNLTRWQRVQLARHPRRPYTLDYVAALTTDFTELHGDRLYADDHAIVGGLARLDGEAVMVIGHQKGKNTKENIYRNFGMPHPEGYRKALRLMQLAGRFGVPIITFIDTPGAFPGIGAEERGQAEAIARNLREMARIPVPILCVIIGEGGSGGALAIAVGDRVLMMENAIYSVISPEGCAAILYGDRARAAEAAEAMKVTATDLQEFDIVDAVISEPMGGAHRDPEGAAVGVKRSIVAMLAELRGRPAADLLRERVAKYRRMGSFETKTG